MILIPVMPGMRRTGAPTDFLSLPAQNPWVGEIVFLHKQISLRNDTRHASTNVQCPCHTQVLPEGNGCVQWTQWGKASLGRAVSTTQVRVCPTRAIQRPLLDRMLWGTQVNRKERRKANMSLLNTEHTL